MWMYPLDNYSEFSIILSINAFSDVHNCKDIKKGDNNEENLIFKIFYKWFNWSFWLHPQFLFWMHFFTQTWHSGSDG